ncbi:unnamed protein product [Pneumocystis jirovecii]|uniref:Ribosome biogenesis regulatory protein n=2 Tax=Pneumocystis jirovecii TaxID=42068 RepID=L0PEB4_PNEJI|nr:uncharacterized protein T551_00716 [Pneumocystis jirovecii RU7]KTW32034.1 hypothetical protein T551_00716 [Pneumocystis jirovecii RU7]CCJ30572.1 unnamed protein product [Pneumocystis jirovecii]
MELSSTINKKSIPLKLDLGNLCAFNFNPLDICSLENNKEEYIMSLSKTNIEILVNKIFSLSKITTLDGFFIELPEPITTLPREKSIQKSKPETKWKKFARIKRIKPKNKIDGKLIYDENEKKWVPKWGYKGKNKNTENQWLIEINSHEDLNTKNLVKSIKKKHEQKKKP